MKLQTLLKKLHACDEAVKWCGDKTPAQAWRECERGDWLLWLAGRMADKPGWPTRKQIVFAACACAETALKYVKPGEDRPRKAIETTRAWVRGEATLEEVRKTAHAASAASYAASSASDASASAASDAASYASAASDKYVRDMLITMIKEEHSKVELILLGLEGFDI